MVTSIRRHAVWFGAWISVLSILALLTHRPLLHAVNGRSSAKLPRISSEARDLHKRLRVVDLHADSLLWPRDLSQRSSRGHVDIPRLLAGNVALQVFSVVTQVPRGQNPVRNRSDSDVIGLLAAVSGWPARTWSDPYERALYQAQHLDALAQETSFRVVRSVSEIDQLLARRDSGQTITGGMLALEGAQPIANDLARVDTLFEHGYRMIGLTHFFDNTVGGSAHGVGRGGLTDFGAEVIARMETLGIVVDLAHASPRLIEDVLSIAKNPVVVSHTGVQGTCPGRRNLSDRQLDLIKANGGVVGIGYWRGALCDVAPAAFAEAARYVVRRIGIQHVGLGSDYDGAVSTAFDTSELSVITQSLLDAGFVPDEIESIMGGNVLRVLRAVLPSESKAVP